MKKTKTLLPLMMSLVLTAGLFAQAGCTPAPAPGNETSEQEGSVTKEETSSVRETSGHSEEESKTEVQHPTEDQTGLEGSTEEKESKEPDSSRETPEETESAPLLTTEPIRIGSLKGPTSIGLAPLMAGEQPEDSVNEYHFQVEATADVLLSSFLKDELDIALIPANASAIWYKKFLSEDQSESNVTVIDVNTLGVLYLIGPEEISEPVPLQSKVSDLKEKKIFMTGQGTTPEYVFSYLLAGCGMDPADYHITWFSEAAEVVSALAADQEAYAILPQPYVTIATGKLPAYHMISSLNDCWDDLSKENQSRQVTGVTIVRTAFLKEYPDSVNQFLTDHEQSVKIALSDYKATAQMVVDAGIIENAAVAEKALPYCALTCLTGEEMKTAVSGYLKVLYDANPKSVGGSLPGDDFYYVGTTDSKEPDPKETESKETESKETDPKETDPKETDPKETDSKEPESEKKNEPSDGNFSATPDHVKELGRYYPSDTTSYYSHSGCGAEFLVTGKTCKVTFIGDSQAGRSLYDAYFARILIYVNEVLLHDFLLDEPEKEVTIFEGTTERTATVRILKASEANLSCYGISDIYTDGTISPTSDRKYKIEFIGDSITSAYGVDAKEGDLYSSSVENITKGYAYLCAKQLDADYSIVCASGCGVLSGYAPNRVRNTANLMPAMYDKLGGNVASITEFRVPPSMIRWDFSLYQPDVVVINLGTNDGSYAREDSARLAAFEAEYVKFLKTIRENNPDAFICCTLGLMGVDLYPNVENAVRTYTSETGDTNIASMAFEVQNIPEDGVALDSHPSVKTHEKAAEKLASFLKEHL